MSSESRREVAEDDAEDRVRQHIHDICDDEHLDDDAVFSQPATPSSEPSTSTEFAEPPRKRSRSSAVWSHYKNVAKKYSCNYCSRTYKETCSTTTLNDHLKDKHPSRIRKMEQPKQDRPVHFKPSVELSRRDQEIVGKRLVAMIVSANLPFLFAENIEFQSFVASLNPKYRVPGRMGLKQMLMNEYERVRLQLLQLFARVSGRISITFDFWSSTAAESFLVITAHWISADWRLCKAVLDFHHATERHMGDYVRDCVLRTLRDFRITHKVLGVTTDEGSNMVSGFRLMEPELATERSRRGSKNSVPTFRLRCLAHAVHNVAATALLHRDNVVKKVRAVIIMLKRPAAKEEFRKALGKKNLKLQLDVDTRWNSTFYMLRSAIDLRGELDEYLVNGGNVAVDMMLDDEEWTKATELIELLSPFEEVTRDCSSSDNPTIHLGVSSFELLMNHLQLLKLSEVDSVASAATLMQAKMTNIQATWKQPVTTVARVLDPTFKVSQYINESARAAAIKDLKDYFAIYKTEADKHVQPSNDTETSKKEVSKPITIRQRLSQQSADVGNVRDEVMEYLALPLEKDLEDDQLLLYWKRNTKRFPILSAIARDVLATQSTSSQSERENSKAKHVITDLRSKLASSAVQATMCLKSWQKLPAELLVPTETLE